MAKKGKLVIVESPAKVKTLGKILGRGYTIKATMGHIRDLPKSSLGVDIENGFAPKYVTPRQKSKIARELKQAVKAVATVYLATDPDREGEAIAWHLKELTQTNKVTYRRVVFQEITRPAIERAFKSTRPIDLQLVNAQQARRILDRLVGYKLSPLLWRRVKRGLSAGRVQSVAVRIIVEREREIEKFTSQEYWSIQVKLAKKAASKQPPFDASLAGLSGGIKLEIHSLREAEEIKEELEQSNYRVLKAKTKKLQRQPPPPFITSTLQQDAWRKLHFSAKQTMVVAQQLYEGLTVDDEGSVGLITYMRTDSTRVARSAIAETREFIAGKYGAEFVPPHARTFINRVKGAQEAHEAIRPTDVRRQPSLIKSHLNNAQFKLYRLIWERMVASQMAAATFKVTAIDIEAKHPPSKTKYLLRSSCQASTFPGFMALYAGVKDEEKGASPLLPPLKEGDELERLDVLPEQHFTQPPPRFTEATLIKCLEQFGIGRPSTYAPTLSTIQDRLYVTKSNGALEPTPLGITVNDLIVRYFGNVVNVEFTASMEDKLDEIANEGREWVQVVQDFYTPFSKDLERATLLMEKVKLVPEKLDEVCPEPECGKPLVVKDGRYGKFIACSGYPQCKFTKPFLVKIGVMCPQCDGDIVEKRSKKKRIFYGCSSYPECRFVAFSKPLPQPCPECGGLLTAYRSDWAKCTKCPYKGKLKQD